MTELSRTHSSRPLIVGTRGSMLAMRQTRQIVAALRRHHPALTIVIREIRTTGDADQRSALQEIGGQGVFVREIEDALGNGTIDLAVHSLKDLPARPQPGLMLGAVPKREDPHDVLIARSGHMLAMLPKGAVVGTGSGRRAAQLHAHRPDLLMADLRGNVDTRIAKALDLYGPYDAIILALAGLKRLKRLNAITEILPFEIMLPAPGQGALGLEIRADDRWAGKIIAPLNHPHTAVAVTAERAFLAELGVGCQAPVAALGRVHGASLWLEGMVVSGAGPPQRLTIQGRAEEAISLGADLARRLADKRSLLE